MNNLENFFNTNKNEVKFNLERLNNHILSIIDDKNNTQYINALPK